MPTAQTAAADLAIPDATATWSLAAPVADVTPALVPVALGDQPTRIARYGASRAGPPPSAAERCVALRVIRC